MNRRNYLKPFVSSVATLLATTQAGAVVPANLPVRAAEEARFAQPSSVLDVTLYRPAAEALAVSDAHGSHSSHASHASHSSHASSSF